MNKQKQIEEYKQKIAKLEVEIRLEGEKNIWIKIPELKIEITNKQMFNGKTYPEILKEVKEEEIASYELMQKLRNSGKYDFLKEFWVFVPNPDLISKKNNYIARFGAFSGSADLFCNWDASYSAPSLGVFLVRELK